MTFGMFFCLLIVGFIGFALGVTVASDACSRTYSATRRNLTPNCHEARFREALEKMSFSEAEEEEVKH